MTASLSFRFLMIFVALGVLAGGPLVSLAKAADKVEQATEEREEKDRKKKAKERTDNIKTEMLYTRMLRPNFMAIGPYLINLMVDGKPIAGQISFAIEAVDVPAKQLLENNERRVNGILFPLAMTLYKNGRPGPRDVREFKEEAKRQLSVPFGDKVTEVYIRTLM